MAERLKTWTAKPKLKRVKETRFTPDGTPVPQTYDLNVTEPIKFSVCGPIPENRPHGRVDATRARLAREAKERAEREAEGR